MSYVVVEVAPIESKFARQPEVFANFLKTIEKRSPENVNLELKKYNARYFANSLNNKQNPQLYFNNEEYYSLFCLSFG